MQVQIKQSEIQALFQYFQAVAAGAFQGWESGLY